MPKTFFKLAKLTFLLTAHLAAAMFWALYLLRIGHGAARTLWRVRSMHAGSRTQCSSCGTWNQTTGRWVCEVCRARYDGSVWRCGRPFCGAVTPWTSCQSCGHYIENPYLTEVR